MKLLRYIYSRATKTRLRKVLSSILVVLILLTSIRFLFLKPKEVQAADVYLGFDEGYGTSNAVNDSNGTISAGSITNAVWKSEEYCKTGKCLYFDGTGDYVSFSDDADLDMGTGETVTVEGWFRTPDITSGTRTIIAKEESTGADGGYRIEIDSSGFVRFGIDNDNSGFPSDSVTSTSAYDDNKWHHFAAVKNGGTSITLYIDAMSVGTPDTSIQNDISNDDSFYIGIYNGTSNGFTGFIDEVKVLRSARTAVEVKADYNGETPTRGTSASFGPDNSFLTNGLVGYWKMDENTGTSITDYSGNAGTGTFYEATTSGTNGPTWTAGKYGPGADFSGTDDVIRIPETTATDLGELTQSFSLSIWFKTTTGTSTTPNLLVKTDGSGGNYWGMYLNSTEAPAFGVSGTGTGTVSGPSAMNDGVWHHLVGIRNVQQDKLYLYVDGVLADEDADAATTTSANDDDISIGNGGVSYNGLDFTGQLDEARIYNRALSSSEVAKLYNWAPGPVAHWKMDENEVDTANDSSGNNSTGTWNGTSNHYVAGKFGSAGNFNGANNDYFSAGSPTAIDDIPSGGGMSISLWFKASFIDGVFFNNLINKDNNGVNGWAIYLARDDRNIVCRVDMATSDVTQASTNAVWNYDTWTHLEVTLDTSNTSSIVCKMYINGTLNANQGTGSGAYVTDAGRDLEIGRQNNLSTNELYGQTDDVKIYNYVRSSSQVIEDMNGNHPAPGSPIGSAVGYWNFDEGYGDTAHNIGSSGSAADGNLYGSFATCPAAGNACPAWTNSGKIGKALDYTLSESDYFTSGDPTALRLTSSGTVSMWIYPEAYAPGSSWSVIQKKGDWGGGLNNYSIYYQDSGSQLRFEIGGSSGYNTVVLTNTVTPLNTWTHIVLMWDGSKLKAYVNGVERGSTAQTQTPNTATHDFIVGSGTGGSFGFEGKIDELRVYNFALNPDQIKAEYNQGSMAVMGSLSTNYNAGTITASNSDTDSYCPPDQASACVGPVAHWKMDENSGTSTTADSSTSGYTGTLNGISANNWTSGKHGSSLYFNPTNSGNGPYITASPVNMASTPGSAFTISAWVKPAGTQFGTATIVRNGTGTDENYGLFVTNNSKLSFEVYSSGGWQTVESTNSLLTANQWNYVTAVFTQGTGVTYYINGVFAETDALAYTSVQSSSNTVIGATINSQSYLGNIDDVKIYNYARTPAQIAWDYNRGAPIAHWQMDESSWNGTANEVKDASGNGLHGAGSGNANTTSGKINNAGTFDGSGDYVNFGDRFDFTSSFSISSWVNVASTAAEGYIINKNGGPGVRDWAFGTEGDGDFLIRVSSDGTNTAIRYINGVLSTGTWYHIAGIYNSSAQTLDIYVNGVLQNGILSGTIPSSISTTNNNVWIGGRESNSSYWNGLMDDVRVYNYPLTAAQVKMIMNDNSAVKFTQ